MKQIKFLALMLFSVLAINFVNAQTHYSVGLKGGLTLANLSASDSIASTGKFQNYTGFHIGIPVHIQLGKIFAVQPELNFQQAGAKYSNKSDLFEYEASTRFNQLQIPVMLQAGYMLENGFKIYGEAGPYLAYAMSGKSTTTSKFRLSTNADWTTTTNTGSIKFDESDNLKRMDFGVGFGAGVGYKGVVLNARYNVGLSDIESSDFGKLYTRGLNISVGYLHSFGNAE